MSALCKDLRDSIVLQENITDLPTLVDKYETELTRVLDIHAPEKKRMITVRLKIHLPDDREGDLVPTHQLLKG